jgi:hypothetical protein
MPIPVPSSEDDLGECIRFLRREGYDDSEERVAICLSKFRESQGGRAGAAPGAARGGAPGAARVAPPPLPPVRNR